MPQRVRRQMLAGIVLIAAVCSLVPMRAAGEGYARWLKLGLFLVLPAGMLLPAPAQALWLYLCRRRGRKAAGAGAGGTALPVAEVAAGLAPVAAPAPPPPVERPGWSLFRGSGEPGTLLILLVNALFFLAGMYAGIAWRRVDFRPLTRECDRIIAGVNRYRETHGEYPLVVEDVPEYARVSGKSRFSFSQGRVLSRGIEVSVIDSSDATIYLSPRGYLLVIGLEKPFMMSFTRFDVLMASSEHPEWRDDHIIHYITGAD
ncbi:MAG: hypothetical protein HZA54_11020 [Planctomycetes bacterium]|nr:hypothetical protein [Planctomycetota bacterium]